jgi:nucleotide-binding universal stress UspA family protein
MKILAAIDGSPCSSAVTDEILSRTWPKDTEVKILTAIDGTVPFTADSWALDLDYLDQMDQIAMRQAEAVIEQAREKLESRPDSNLKITKEVIKGLATNVILSEAEQWDADLIMVGSHGYHGLKRLMLGSVSQAVASHGKCSVEIVRCPKAAGESPQVVTPVDDQC